MPEILKQNCGLIFRGQNFQEEFKLLNMEHWVVSKCQALITQQCGGTSQKNVCLNILYHYHQFLSWTRHTHVKIFTLYFFNIILRVIYYLHFSLSTRPVTYHFWEMSFHQTVHQEAMSPLVLSPSAAGRSHSPLWKETNNCLWVSDFHAGVSKVCILLPHILEEKIPPTEVRLSLGPNILDVKLSLHIIHHGRMRKMLKKTKNLNFYSWCWNTTCTSY